MNDVIWYKYTAESDQNNRHKSLLFSNTESDICYEYSSLHNYTLQTAN